MKSERHRLLHFSSQIWKYFRDIFMQSILHADHHLFRIQLCLMMMIWSLSFKSIDHTSFNFQNFFKEKNSSFNLRFFFLQSGSWSKNRDRGKVSMLSCDYFFYTLEFNRLRMFCCRKTSWKIFFNVLVKLGANLFHCRGRTRKGGELVSRDTFSHNIPNRSKLLESEDSRG